MWRGSPLVHWRFGLSQVIRFPCNCAAQGRPREQTSPCDKGVEETRRLAGRMSGKNVATKVGRAIDWEHLSKVVLSEEGKRELAKLRLAYDDVSYTLETKLNLVDSETAHDVFDLIGCLLLMTGGRCHGRMHCVRAWCNWSCC